MGHTLFLCSVSWLACQSADGQFDSQAVKPCANCQAAQAAQIQDPALPQAQPQPSAPKGPLGLGIWDKMRQRKEEADANQKPGVLQRVQIRVSGWFTHPKEPELGAPVADGLPQAPPSIGAPSSIRTFGSEPPISSPASMPSAMPLRANPTSFPGNTSTVVPPNANLNPRFVDKSGHESDYSWVTGQLNYLNNEWLVEYATPGTVDQFAGKLVLVNVDSKNLQIGDLVCVRGALMSGSNGNVIGAYRVSNISLIERGGR